MAKKSIGEATLDGMIEQFGPDAVQAAIGVWLAAQHRKRSLLLVSSDRKPARAPHYLAFVRQLTCVICGAQEPNDPHHYGSRGVGQKTDDYRTVPLCRRCHDRVHDGKESSDFSPRIVNILVKYLRVVENV